MSQFLNIWQQYEITILQKKRINEIIVLIADIVLIQAKLTNSSFNNSIFKLSIVELSRELCRSIIMFPVINVWKSIFIF